MTTAIPTGIVATIVLAALAPLAFAGDTHVKIYDPAGTFTDDDVGAAWSHSELYRPNIAGPGGCVTSCSAESQAWTGGCSVQLVAEASFDTLCQPQVTGETTTFFHFLVISPDGSQPIGTPIPPSMTLKLYLGGKLEILKPVYPTGGEARIVFGVGLYNAAGTYFPIVSDYAQWLDPESGLWVGKSLPAAFNPVESGAPGQLGQWSLDFGGTASYGIAAANLKVGDVLGIVINFAPNAAVANRGCTVTSDVVALAWVDDPGNPSFSALPVQDGSLHAFPPTVGPSGGDVKFTLDASATAANSLYLVMGSASGSVPGTPIGQQTLPINFDPVTNWSVSAANSPLLPGTFGVLNSLGQAAAALDLSGVVIPGALVGVSLQFAYAAKIPSGWFTSNPVTVVLGY